MAETQLSSAQLAMYEFIFRTAAEGILQTSAEGLCCLLNPAAAAMLQVTESAILGKSPREAFPNNPNLIRLLRPGGIRLLDVPLPGDRIAQGTAQNLPDKTRVLLLYDVTEQRQIESRREALVKAIAHDLRNPISALTGYAELVTKFGDLNEKQLHFVTRIRQTSDKLWDVIASLVDLAWIEAGMPLQYAQMNIAAIIRKVVSELTSEARRRHVKIITSIQEPIPPVMGDSARIKLAIYHLLDNAIQYSNPYYNVGIHAWQQQNQVMCSVVDQGIGIDEYELDQVWDRMWRSSDERVRTIPGGGLGLTYVRTIIKRHGGDISVDSKLDSGTTFTFVLPLIAET